MYKRIFCGLLSAALGLSLAVRASVPVRAASSEGWIRTYDAGHNTIVYTILPEAKERVTIDCADAANTLMAELTLPGQSAQVGIRFENQSGRTYTFETCAFTTENQISRDVPVGVPAPSVRIYPPEEEIAVTDQLGFDGKRIPISMTVLRSVTAPLKEFYGVEDSTDITLRQVVGLEEALEKSGYPSYSAYLLDYYRTRCADPSHGCSRAETLSELHPVHQCEILGSASGDCTGQSEIRKPRFLPFSELKSDDVYAPFLSFGWGGRIDASGKEKRLMQDYELIEQDPQLAALGYRYLYAYGMYFSFDGSGIRIPAAPEELSQESLSLWNYLHQLGPAAEQIAMLKKIVLEPGKDAELPDVTLAVQLPNSYDTREIDFGFSLSFVTDDPVDPPVPTDPDAPSGSEEPEKPDKPAEPESSEIPEASEETGGQTDEPGEGAAQGEPAAPPQTGDESRLWLWLSIAVAASILLFFIVGKLRKERRER